jgi:predicted AlkP superfamily pyrophosphatase or phosphodiesterase
MKSKLSKYLGLTVAALMVLPLTPAPPPCSGAEPPPPKLILQITVDGLRGDMPGRYLDRLGRGGFRRLTENGTVYGNAHYRHSNTETIVGHTILATGANPAASGMVANVWFDRETGALTYNIEDGSCELLTAGAGVNRETEIDPTQKVAKVTGRSAANILTTTFGDELAVHTAGRAKVFGVSVKDRGAVSMAGHAGKAFWFSKKTGDFITTTCYYDEYPPWVAEWNNLHPADRYQGMFWELMREQSTYLHGDGDDRSYETDFPGFGRVFPHPYSESGEKYYYTLLTLSPAGDELTLDFAKKLIEKEQIGQDEVTDYLSISFSSTDYVGHLFGPSSLESEDNILRLDRTLADLLRFVDEKVGLDRTLIVLSADHGAPEAPEYMASLGFGAKRLNPKEMDTAPAIEALKKRFGVAGELVETYYHPYLYLNREVIAEKGLDRREVEEAVAAELMKFDGVALALSSTALREGGVPNAPLVEQVRRNFHPKRSGDVYVVQEPYWFLYEAETIPLCAMHGSPWRYDTFVPVIFAGAGVRAQKVARPVQPADIAPTLSAVLGVKPPSGAVGTPLIEILTGR